MDTIAAIATPPGTGGIGIVRVSGPGATAIARAVTGKLPEPRRALHVVFRDRAGLPIDEGIALYFPGPHSYTGEDVLELQGHGGSAVLRGVLQAALDAGARIARPGEFTERAFVNGRIDLAQAEAVADLINAGSQRAARSALRSLRGEFSQHVNALVDGLVAIRVGLEASLDFPDDEGASDQAVALAAQLQALQSSLRCLLGNAQRGAALGAGIKLVIAGAPNVGKSTLLNRLLRDDVAIVSDIPGTTRDVVHAQLTIAGIPVRVADTAGIRASADAVEQAGVRRAWDMIRSADLVLLVADSRLPPDELFTSVSDALAPGALIVEVMNKIDLLPRPTDSASGRSDCVYISARDGTGIAELEQRVAAAYGFSEGNEDEIVARARHLDALVRADAALARACALLGADTPWELAAEELRLSQQALETITGRFDADDLLGEIFARFCLGK